MTIRGRIRELLALEPDPHRVAERLKKELTPMQRREVLGEALASIVREELRYRRTPPPASHAPTNAPLSPKWERVRLAWLSSAYQVGGEWVRLADCSLDQVELIAADYEARAAQNAAYASRFHALAQTMRERGVSVVGELDDADLAVAA